MYDISQLNDLLVPELHDIADQLNISNSKKMNKQELVSTILDKQTNMTTDDKIPEAEKPKRKRIAKSDAPEPQPQQLFKKEAAAPRPKTAVVASGRSHPPLSPW